MMEEDSDEINMEETVSGDESSQEEYGSENEHSDADADNDATVQSENMLKEKLKDLSYEELDEVEKKLGPKKFNQVFYGESSIQPKKKKTVFKRPIKNRPMEMTSKKPKTKVGSAIPRITDPRFNPRVNGTFDKKKFNRDYAFLSDYRQKDIKKLDRLLDNEKNPIEKEKIRKQLLRLKNKERDIEMTQVRNSENENSKRQIIDKLNAGKKPYFLKKSAIKDMKMKEREESGTLNKYLIRKEKKKLAKEYKSLN